MCVIILFPQPVMEENSADPTTTVTNNNNNKTTSNVPPNPAPTSSVQKQINELNKASSNNKNAMPSRPASVASSYRVGTSSRLGMSGIPAKRTPVKKPLAPMPKSTALSKLKAPTPMTVTASSYAARRVAASRISSSQIQSTIAKKAATSTVRASVTSVATNKRTTSVPRPAPPLAIRTGVKATKKESSIPQASRRITATSTTRTVKEKAVSKEENEMVTEENDVRKHNNGGNDNKCQCQCDDNQNCVCKLDEEIDSDASSCGKGKGGGTSLKKTKSTRTPQRHATYVSELNKDIRRKFQKQKAERKHREGGEKVDVKKTGATAQRPRIASKPTTTVTPKTTKKRLDVASATPNERNMHNKIASSPGRIVHCPLHSKFGNQLSSRFIKARCIPECPHFHESSTTRNRSDSHSSSTSSTISSPVVKKRPVTGVGTAARSKSKTTTVPYVITTSNKKTVTARRSGPGSVANVRVRSAPAVSQAKVSSVTKKPVQSYLVRNGMIPDPVKSHITSHHVVTASSKTKEGPSEELQAEPN